MFLRRAVPTYRNCVDRDYATSLSNEQKCKQINNFFRPIPAKIVENALILFLYHLSACFASYIDLNSLAQTRGLVLPSLGTV